MQIINSSLISGKKVLLRLDIDVPIGKGTGDRVQVIEDFRLRVGLPTLKMCLENASQVIVIGHIGRPEGRVVKELSVAPIVEWFKGQGLNSHLTSGKLKVLENLRFDPREESGDISFARELAGQGDIYVNEAFASYRPAVSTTVLPTLLPHLAGLRFAKEVEKLRAVRENPKKPFVAIMGGAKVADKLPVIEVLSKIADAVLVGGKLVHELRLKAGPVSSISHRASSLANRSLRLRAGTPFSLPPALPRNVMVGMLTEDGFDIAPQTVSAWAGLIAKAKMIVWNGPVGRIQSSKFKVQNLGSERGSYEISKLILESQAEIIVGGGDTVGFLGKIGLLEKFEQKGFVSTGGGAMLKLLTDGTLPTIDALK